MNPYLSIIAAARNDDHGGNLLGRMSLFIHGLAEQCDRFNLDAELVLVEWNPPGDRPRLREALAWPSKTRLAIRLIEVPPERHARFQHADRLPLFQMIAKNVGIRRAAAPFVLATNIDLLFSNPLMKFLARRSLDPRRMYRVDRLDADRDIPPGLTLDERLAWCASHLLRINRREGIHLLRTGEVHRIYWPASPRVALLEMLQDLRLVPTVTRERLHLNACGDFTLMHRDAWHTLRGYAELEMYSMHLDSLLCTAAHFGPARERALPPSMCAYHIEHGKGWSPEGERELNARLAAAGIPQMSHDQFHRHAVQMRRDRRPLILNDENWGLAREVLHEEPVA